MEMHCPIRATKGFLGRVDARAVNRVSKKARKKAQAQKVQRVF